MVCPASARRRAVSNPRLLLAPVISVVVMPQRGWPPAGQPADSSSWECRYQAAAGRAAHTGLVAFAAARGSEDADKLRLLAVLGTQDFSPRV
jgi:hypothetical protein